MASHRIDGVMAGTDTDEQPLIAAGSDQNQLRSRQAPAGRPPHLIASGLIGEPVPPVMLSGGAQKKNSKTRSAAQSAASSAR